MNSTESTSSGPAERQRLPSVQSDIVEIPSSIQTDVTADGVCYDLSRRVFGILGIPVDAIDLGSVIRTIKLAAASKAPFLLSTPNLNFLVTSQTDPDFRDSLLLSDLCPVDGIPIVWIARLLGVPINQRVAGSDIFEGLRINQVGNKPSNVFLFGGPPGVAEAAAKVLNSEAKGVYCVGHLYPGYGSIDDMSTQVVIDSINASRADVFVASLGARKGQEWLMKNRHRLQIPVRSHLGAAINFQAGLLKRAPLRVRKSGFEWLWRIKEEPYLWRRYRDDGLVLMKLMIMSVLPLAINARWRRLKPFGKKDALAVQAVDQGDAFQMTLVGAATTEGVAKAVPTFQNALETGKSVIIDVSGVSIIDMRFFGLLLMLRKQLIQRGLRLEFTGLTSRMRKEFRLNRFEFLIPSPNGERSMPQPKN